MPFGDCCAQSEQDKWLPLDHALCVSIFAPTIFLLLEVQIVRHSKSKHHPLKYGFRLIRENKIKVALSRCDSTIISLDITYISEFINVIFLFFNSI